MSLGMFDKMSYVGRGGKTHTALAVITFGTKAVAVDSTTM